MRWPSVRGAARVLALAAGLLALALPLTIMAAQGGASPYQWTTSVAGSSQLHGVVWDGSQFVAFGDGGAVFTSPDGQSWSAAKSGTDKPLQAAAWSGKNLVAVGSEGLLLQSADAKAWSVKAHGLPAAASAVAYGQLKADKGLFVAVGPQGLLLTSHDGSTWKHRVSGTAQNLNAVTYGDGLFVAVGDAGAILTSADGKQWSPASGASASLQGVAFGNGLYVAVGQNGALFTSADGRVWTAAQDPQQESLNAVAFTGIGFVAVGQGGAIVRSADGQNWTAEQSPLSTWLHGVAYGQSHVVAVGDGGIVVLAVTPYYIGGVVTVQTSGQPIAGVTLSAAGVANPGPYTATSSATGSYQINNLPNNDTYTVTPTGGAGWTFTPATASVPIAGATATQNFVVTANTITARVTNSTGAPITPTITATGGGNTFTVTAAALLANSSSQNYIVRVPPGIYTVTASADHTMFTPASIPNVDASAGSPNITATPFVGVAAYLQAGHFYVGDCGVGNTTTPIQGVIVTATDGTNIYTAVSDSAGAFQFFLAPGTWTLHFAKGGTMFCPDNGTPNDYTITVQNPPGDVTSYAWYGQGSYSISGTVTIGGGVAPLKNATLTIAGTGTTPTPSPNTVTTNTNGDYIFNYLPAGSYTVTPSYTPALIFSPASSGTLTLGPSLTAVNFDASTPTFAGTVTDSATSLGISGVTITADDGNGHVFHTATGSAPLGGYTLPVLPGFTYTLTPTAPAGTTYTFTPASASLAIDTGTVPQNFTATQIFPVSGYVYVGPATTTGIPGVTITATINSAPYNTQTTDANGHFSFNLPEGVANQVTFNLSKAGFTFSNNSFTYTVSGAYSGLVFYGSESYSVTGTVMLGSAGLQNVKVTLTPGTLNALTDPSGNFSIANVPVSTTSYTATPSLAGYTFSPVSSPVTVLAGGPAPGPLAFTATQVFSIKGTVTATVPTDKFIVTATSGANTYSSPAVAGSGATYTISGVPAGTYTLTIATASGTTNTYVYTPPSITGLVVAGNVTLQNFAATQTFAVSGYVKNGATAIPGVTITATINSVLYDTQTTDGSGHFSFNLPKGSQAVFNLSKSNFTFTPNPYTYPSPLAASDATLLFSGTEFYSISGTVTVQPGGGVLSGATITVTPGPYTATTGSDGSYTVANVPVSTTAYTVTPSLPGYVFNPTNQPVTVPAGGPAPSGVNFTATPLLTISGTVSGFASGDTFVLTANPGNYHATSNGTTGAYTIQKVPASATSYTLTIAPASGVTNTYLFNPASLPVTLTSTNVTGQNFQAAQTYAYTGFVYKKLGTTYTSTPVGTAIPITVTSASGSPFGPFTATADAATGAFSVTLPAGNWTWAMTLSGWNFVDGGGNPLPEAIAITGPQGGNIYRFYAVQLLSISGSVKDGSGNGVTGVTITAQGSTQSYTIKTGTSGSYTTPLLPADVYTVYATLTGYQFNGPFSVNLTNGSNVTGINFVATALSSISGTVLDSNKKPIVGLTVSAGGSYTATTASDGTYTIPSLPTGTYTVTPGPLAGYIFSPASQSVTLTSTTPYTGVDFTGTAIFNIKGTVTLSGGSTGLAGVLVSAGGSYTATTASNGTYTIPNVPAGSYTLTPSLAGYGFNPSSHGVTVSTADVTQNFTAFKAHSISGKVTAGTTGVAGVLISAGSGLVATTASDGTYVITNVPDSASPYTVTASLVGFTFSPASQPATVNGADATGINFAATQVFNIKGTVTDSNSKGVAGVSISAGTGLTAITAADGTYTIANVPMSATAYTVTPTKTGYTFSPANRSVTVSSSDVTLVNFTATAVYTISGTVKDGSGNGVKGVTITAGTGLTATTAADGTYTIANVPAGTYTLTPSLSVYSFTPATLAETVSTSNVTGANFTITYFTVTATSDKTSGNEPLTVSFSSAVAGGLGPYTYDWSFGDGSTDGTTASIAHTFTKTGLYTVQLTVTDANKNSVAANAISIQVGQPTLAVTATAVKTSSSSAAPVTFAFTATATGGSGSYTYTWSFGDGGTGTGATASHTYTTGGNFTATVTVADSLSNTASASASVSVLPPPTIAAVTKMTSPFRLKIMGANFHLNPIVKINGVPVPLSDLKSSALIIAKKGAALSAMVPKGVPVQITVTNTDDGGVSTAYSFVR